MIAVAVCSSQRCSCGRFQGRHFHGRPKHRNERFLHCFAGGRAIAFGDWQTSVNVEGCEQAAAPFPVCAPMAAEARVPATDNLGPVLGGEDGIVYLQLHNVHSKRVRDQLAMVNCGRSPPPIQVASQVAAL